LRTYFDERYRSEVPTAAERASLRKGRAEIRRGDYVTYDQLLDVLDSTSRAPRRKVARKKSR
jgi:hypothetical protein